MAAGDPFDYSHFSGSPRESTPAQMPGDDGSASPLDVTITRPEPTQSGWGTQTSPQAEAVAEPRRAGPPVIWLFSGIALAVIAGAAALVFGSFPAVAISSWVVAGPVAISAFAVFTLRDTSQRLNVLYSSGVGTPWIYRIGMVIVFVAIMASALQIALWVGRL